MTAFFHSIRWRVQAWHAAILLLAIMASCLTAYRLAWINQLRRIDESLTLTERKLFRALAETAKEHSPVVSGNGPKRIELPQHLLELLAAGKLKLPDSVAPIFQGQEPGFVYFSFRDASGRVLMQSANAPADLQLLPAPREEFVEETRTFKHRREFAKSSFHGLRGLVGRDITPEVEATHRFGWSLGGLGLAIWTTGLLGGWWLAGGAIRPIANISRTAARIASGKLDDRINVSNSASELDQLGRVLNQTFDRLHAALEQQRQFTGDASHELRTPVTILLMEVQRALKRERPAAEYQQTLRTCEQTILRMRTLVESLLLLARQEGADAPPMDEICDLAEISRNVVMQLQPLAAAREVVLRTDELQSARCLGNNQALSILVHNLIANAIQHGREAGLVSLTSGIRENGAFLKVYDDGPGIPEADMPYIFDRFYRADKARTGSSLDSGSTNHAGLGLAIAKTIVENHGGSITAANKPGGGSEFGIWLPTRRNIRP